MLRRQQRKEVAKARSVEELEKIAAARGYKPGWVKNVMANREKKYSEGMQ
jgi:hypothetical protein